MPKICFSNKKGKNIHIFVEDLLIQGHLHLDILKFLVFFWFFFPKELVNLPPGPEKNRFGSPMLVRHEWKTQNIKILTPPRDNENSGSILGTLVNYL